MSSNLFSLLFLMLSLEFFSLSFFESIIFKFKEHLIKCNSEQSSLNKTVKGFINLLKFDYFLI